MRNVKRNIFLLIVGIIGCNNILYAEEKSLTALQIMEKENVILTHNKALDQKATIVIESYNKNGKKREKICKYFIKRDYIEKKEKYLVDVSYPADIKGVRFLGWTYPKAPDARWIYLPSLQLTRQISASNISGNFIGTDFSYEDITLRSLNNYTYKLLRGEDYNSQECYVIEGLPVDMGDTDYSKIIFWVRKDIFAVVKMELYRKKDGKLCKIEVIDEIKMIDGYWTYIKSTMHDILNKSRTTATLKDLEFNTNIPEEIFTPQFLKRGF